MTRSRWWRGLVGLWAVLTLGLGLWIGGDLTYVLADATTEQAAPADVIIVLGCPSYENNVPAAQFSACVQVRAHHAADLYRRGLAAQIIPSGGLTGPPPSEAAAMAQVMEQDGVPAASIIMEDRARNTVQNLAYSQAIMLAHGWRTAILVSEPHHIKRAAWLARDAGLSVFLSPATDSPSWHYPPARILNVARDTQTLLTYQARRLLTQGP